MFGKKKDKKGEAPKAKEPKQRKAKKNKKSFLEKAGVKVEKMPSQEDENKLQRMADEKKVWEYIRYQIDVGSAEYINSGNSGILKENTKGQVYQDLIAHLDTLRAQGITVTNPNRLPEMKNYHIEIVGERLGENNSPTQFTVREQAPDTTIMTSSDGRQVQADRSVRSIQAVVDIEGENYQVTSLVRLSGAGFN